MTPWGTSVPAEEIPPPQSMVCQDSWSWARQGAHRPAAQHATRSVAGRRVPWLVLTLESPWGGQWNDESVMVGRGRGPGRRRLGRLRCRAVWLDRFVVQALLTRLAVHVGVLVGAPLSVLLVEFHGRAVRANPGVVAHGLHLPGNPRPGGAARDGEAAERGGLAGPGRRTGAQVALVDLPRDVQHGHGRADGGERVPGVHVDLGEVGREFN